AAMWRGADDALAREALRAAVDQGVTFFDTALAYGSGHSERLIGEVLRDHIRAGRVRIATKVPPLNEEWPGRANRPLAAVFPVGHVAASTETSLRISASRPCRCNSSMCGTTPGWTIRTGRRATTGWLV